MNVFKIFLILLNPFSTGKIKKPNFEMPAIIQTYTSIIWEPEVQSPSICSYTIRKLIRHPLKSILFKDNIYSYRLRDIAVRRQVGIITRPAGTGKGLMKKVCFRDFSIDIPKGISERNYHCELVIFSTKFIQKC